MTAPNPNWPRMDYAVCWSAGPNASPVQNLWSSFTERTEGRVSIRRGKQYELDQCQPGEQTMTVRNDDGVLDAANGASPWAGFVKPYRLLRQRAQWPATSNILTADQATARFSSVGAYTGSVLPACVGASGSMPVTIVPGVGVNLYNIAYAAHATAGQGMFLAGFTVEPGQTYSVQASVQVTTGVSMTVAAAIQWFAADGGTVLATTGGTPVALGTSLTEVTVTDTAPANAAGAVVYLLSQVAPTSAVVVQATQWQVEEGPAPTAWVQPGAWFSMFTGYAERWPQSWTSGGNYGLVNLTVVDLFSVFASRKLRNVFEMDLLALGPNFLYRLDESQGSSAFADATGLRGTAPLYRAATPYLSSGSSVTSADNAPIGCDGSELTGAFLGSPGPVLTTKLGSILTPAGRPRLPTNGAAVAIPAGPDGYGPPTSGAYMRIIAARFTPGTSLVAMPVAYPWVFQNLPAANDAVGLGMGATHSPMAMYALIGNQASPVNFEAMPGLPAQGVGPSGAITDGDWHLYLVGYDPSSKKLYAGVDGRLTSTTLSADANPSPVNRRDPTAWADLIGMAITSAGDYAFAGDLAYATEFSFLLSSGQWANLYQSWRNGWASNPDQAETSDSRYARILAWLGYSGPSRISAGYSVAYGPAIDIAGGTSPTYGLTALQNVVDTEGGQHFVAADGTVVFNARGDRYNQAPVLSFGEMDGEVAYLSAVTDFDPTLVVNDATISATYGSANYTSVDPSASTDDGYGDLTGNRTVNSLDPNELQAAADALVYQNKNPLHRLEAITIDVGANPAYWPLMLGLDLGDCVVVNRRPSNAPEISITGFVEQIQWSLGDDLTALCTLQISNSSLHTFWQLDSATLGVLGVSTIPGY